MIEDGKNPFYLENLVCGEPDGPDTHLRHLAKVVEIINGEVTENIDALNRSFRSDVRNFIRRSDEAFPPAADELAKRVST